MQKADIFTVKSTEREPEPRILLSRPGEAAVIAIDAVTLLAQYLLHNGDVLLILDEDSPYEEQLHLVLLRDAHIIDHVLIGAPYASGIFREVGAENDVLTFRFESEAIWRVSVDGEGSRGPAGFPPGAHHRGGWLAKRYLSLSWTPAS